MTPDGLITSEFDDAAISGVAELPGQLGQPVIR
jgi:hypothetical protein